MDASIRSASLGPPKREFRASGLKPRLVGGAASGSLAVVEEFSTLHFRSSLSPGSMLDEDLDDRYEVGLKEMRREECNCTTDCFSSFIACNLEAQFRNCIFCFRDNILWRSSSIMNLCFCTSCFSTLLKASFGKCGRLMP